MKSFTERIAGGETIICAEGYLLEIARRGYLTAGPYIPEIILEHPEMIAQLHREFAHAGSDILVACLYYVNKAKLSGIGKVAEFERMNKEALRICVQVARETGTLAAGNLCNSVEFDREDPASVETVRAMFKEQVEWAVAAGVDLFVCETFREWAEADLALQVVKDHAPGSPPRRSPSAKGPSRRRRGGRREPAPYGSETLDGLSFAEALGRLHAAGAVVAGLNCARGPSSMLRLAEELREEFKGPLALSPLPLRTTEEHPTWATLPDPVTGKTAWPDNVETVSCSTDEIEDFARRCKELDVAYIGLCCGNSGRYTRHLALAAGHACPARKFSSQAHNSNMNRIRNDIDKLPKSLGGIPTKA